MIDWIFEEAMVMVGDGGSGCKSDVVTAGRDPSRVWKGGGRMAFVCTTTF